MSNGISVRKVALLLHDSILECASDIRVIEEALADEPPSFAPPLQKHVAKLKRVLLELKAEERRLAANN
jgi:hypothetical protein